MLRSAWGLLPVLAVVGLLACSSKDNSDNSAPDATSFDCPSDTASIQARILAPKCGTAGCHAAEEPANGLDLVSPGLEARLVGVNAKALKCASQVLVVEGDADASYLLHKIRQDTPQCGAAMPLRASGQPGLSAAEISCLRTWIGGLKAVPDAGVDAVADSAIDAPADSADAMTCPTGQSACSGACVDLTNNSAHCGACGKSCGTGQMCLASTCACTGGGALCGGACVDTNTSTANCGGCGKACVTGQTCTAGACTCLGGLTSCSGTCVDTNTSATNCGMCGNACASGSFCSAGSCVSSCPSGTTACSGSCVDLTKDSFHCGACATSCPSGTSCVASACVCPSGTRLCGTTCVDTTTDSSNCGGCGTTCSGGTSCVSGACACGSGKVSCGGTCVDTSSDPSNCGGCGTACATGATCTASACACPSGQTACGAKCVTTSSDPANCGACGVACTGGKFCSGGACTCGASVSLSGTLQPLLTATCTGAGCHGAFRPAEGLDMSTSAKSYAGLVGVASTTCAGKTRVTAASVPNSYLINKLDGTFLGLGCIGSRMPKGGPFFSTAQMDSIKAWICNGAPNN